MFSSFHQSVYGLFNLILAILIFAFYFVYPSIYLSIELIFYLSIYHRSIPSIYQNIVYRTRVQCKQNYANSDQKIRSLQILTKK